MKGSVVLSVGLCFALILSAQVANSASNDSSKSDKGSLKNMWVNWGNLDVLDYLRTGFLLIAFLVTVLGDKRGSGRYGPGPWHWPAAETLALLLAGGTAYFFPVSGLEYQTSAKTNLWHIIEMQMNGCILISLAVTTFAMNNLGTDALVGSTWLLTRILTAITLVFLSAYTHIFRGIMTDQHAVFVIGGLKMWFFGGLLQLRRSNNSRSFTRPTTDNYVTMHLLIDILISMPVILGCLAMPEEYFALFGMEKADPLLIHLNKVGMVMMAGNSIHTLLALFYDNDADRKAILKGRVVLGVLSLVVLCLYQWKHHHYPCNTFITACVMTAVVTLNAAAGCFGPVFRGSKRSD